MRQAGPAMSLFRPHASLPQRSSPEQKLDLYTSHPPSLLLVSFLGGVYHTALYALLPVVAQGLAQYLVHTGATKLSQGGRTWGQAGFTQGTPLGSKCWGQLHWKVPPAVMSCFMPTSKLKRSSPTPSTSECDLIWKYRYNWLRQGYILLVGWTHSAVWPQTHTQGECRVKKKAEICKPRNTKGCQPATRASRRQAKILPGSTREVRTHCDNTLNLDLWPSELWDNKFLLFKSNSLCGSLLEHPYHLIQQLTKQFSKPGKGSHKGTERSGKPLGRAGPGQWGEGGVLTWWARSKAVLRYM